MGELEVAGKRGNGKLCDGMVGVTCRIEEGRSLLTWTARRERSVYKERSGEY